jgi:Replication-relaxation
MASTPFCIVTPRDSDLFQSLERRPLTVQQLLKVSRSFSYRFTTERRVQERLQRLCAAGRVRRWRYATAGQGALSYFTLSPLGYRLLQGQDAIAPPRGLVGPVGVARQAHTMALAEAIVHLAVGAHATGVALQEFRRENAVRLTLGEESLYPDSAFALSTGPASRYPFFLETDNRTETVWPGSSLGIWGRKVQFYERYQDAHKERFRVLAITTGGRNRMEHMLSCAAVLARNPRRSLVYGIALAELLKEDEPLRGACCRNHYGKAVTLLPDVSVFLHALQLTATPAMVGSSSCLRPIAEV